MTKLFVVGTGRCGTASIAYAFDQSPEITSLHEPEPTLEEMASHKLNGDKVSLLKLEAMRPDLPEHYVESAIWNTWLIEEILELWPESKFVWLQRDPFTWAYSAFRRGWYEPRSEEIRSVSMRLLRPSPHEEWPSGVSRWFKLGWMYQVYMREITKSFLAFPNTMTLFNMMDLGDIVRLNGLARWAGLPGGIRVVEHVNKGELYITAKEMMSAGLDASKFGEDLGWETPLSIRHLVKNTPWPLWKLESIAKEKRTQVNLPIEAAQDLLSGLAWHGV